MKNLTRQRMRLAVRRAGYSAIRSDRNKGYKRPGSMNSHKSTSIKLERKKR